MKESTIRLGAKNKSNRDEAFFFFRRWLRHPLRLGAVLPSSSFLATLITQQVSLRPDGAVVELGAGTGCLTRVLLQSGIPHDRLFIVELDSELCKYLKRSLPDAHVIHGNACDLPELLPSQFVGRVSTVISGMPMTNMSLAIQQKIIDASFSVMDDVGEFLQYSYRPVSPIPSGRLGLKQERVGVILRNLPPATVWRYKKEHHNPIAA